jgi:hypothetical protein
MLCYGLSSGLLRSSKKWLSVFKTDNQANVNVNISEKF